MLWNAAEIPWLALFEISRHKITFEAEQYGLAKRMLRARSEALDRRLSWFVRFQRAHDAALQVGGAPETRELVEKLGRAATETGDIARVLAWMDDVANTVRVNQENLSRAVQQLGRAGADDDLFPNEQEWVAALLAQMEVDRVYHHTLANRAAGVLAMATSRLQVGLAHQTREQASMQGIQTSVIASFGSVVAVSQVRAVLPALQHLSGGRMVGLMLATFATAFSVCQVVLNWQREKLPVDRFAVALASGLWVGWLLTQAFPGGTPLFVLGFLGAGSAAYLAFLMFETKPRRRGPATVPFRAQGPEEEALPDDEIKRLLQVARRELSDLLEDLPAATVFRVKAEDSILEKLVRRGEPVAALSDVIGIRYVVPPYRVPRTVRRVFSALNVHEIEYKTGDYRAVHIGRACTGWDWTRRWT